MNKVRKPKKYSKDTNYHLKLRVGYLRDIAPRLLEQFESLYIKMNDLKDSSGIRRSPIIELTRVTKEKALRR